MYELLFAGLWIDTRSRIRDVSFAGVLIQLPNGCSEKAPMQFMIKSNRWSMASTQCYSHSYVSIQLPLVHILHALEEG